MRIRASAWPLRAQRQVDDHLVAVEVGVERGADQRVHLDGLALDQLRLERLMPSRCSVGARLSSTGCSAMTSQHVPHDRGWSRSTIRLADLMFCAWRSTSRFITNGFEQPSAIWPSADRTGAA